MSDTHDIADRLAENPKLMGALWTLALVLAETGSAAAAQAGSVNGP